MQGKVLRLRFRRGRERTGKRMCYCVSRYGRVCPLWKGWNDNIYRTFKRRFTVMRQHVFALVVALAVWMVGNMVIAAA